MNVQTDPKQLSPLTLAYIGDGVYELFVREYIVSKGNCPVKKLHARAVEMVRCEFQAKMLTEHLQPLLTETEAEICRRGRNAHVHQIPKNATREQYAKATGLECLFGALYLAGRVERLNELFFATMEEPHAL